MWEWAYVWEWVWMLIYALLLFSLLCRIFLGIGSLLSPIQNFILFELVLRLKRVFCLCSKPNLYRTKQSIFWITTTNKQLLHIHKIYSNLWAEKAARVLVFASYNEHFFSKSPCNKCLCVCVSVTQCSRRFLHCAYRYSERFCRVFVVIFVVARHDGSLSFSADWKAISDSLVFPCDWIKSILNE